MIIILYSVIILILFIIINQYLTIKENYLTYFLPFYTVESKPLRNFYINDDYNKNFFKHKLNYEVFSFLGSKKNPQSNFLKQFSKRLLSKSNIVQSNYIELDNDEIVLEKLNENKNAMSMITIPTYLDYAKDNNNLNISLLSNLYSSYLLVLTKLKYNINSLNEINSDTKIGIFKNNTINNFYQKLFTDMNKSIKNIKIYNTLKKLQDSLLNDENEVIIYFSELPSSSLDELIQSDYESQVIILPFDLSSKISSIFFKKNDYAKIGYFDLNKIEGKYLPKKFGDYYYFMFKPTIKLLKINQYLVCNKHLNKKVVRDVFSYIFEYRKSYNDGSYMIENIEPNYDLIKYIPFHPEVLKVFREKGYITNINNDNCKYFVGVKECTDKVLEDNGMEII